MNVWQWADVVTAVVAVVAGCWCVCRYHRLAPWRGTATGRHVMEFSATVTVLCALSVADPPARPCLAVPRGVVLLLIALLLMRRASMVARAQRRSDPDGAEGLDRSL